MAIWLGVYIVTRSPRSKIAWLTGLGLWSIAGLFLNVLFALNPPPNLSAQSVWLRFILFFWPEEVLQDSSAWLKGWSIAPGIVIWHHVTTLMRGKAGWWRRLRIWIGYLLAAPAVWFQNNTDLLIYTDPAGDPLFVSGMRAGPLLPFFAFLMVVFVGFSLVNLIRSSRETASLTQRNQLETLASATLVAGLAGPIAIAGFFLDLNLPMAAISAPLAIGLGMIGYGVARYSALMEGRTILRDLSANAIATVLVILLYTLAGWGFSAAFQLPIAGILALVLLAIVTHGVVIVWRDAWILVIRRPRIGAVRANLRRLSRLARGSEDVEENLDLSLNALCTAVTATYGLIFVFENETAKAVARYRWGSGEAPIPPALLAADDVHHILPAHFAAPYEEAALLVPLYADGVQLGALVLGRPVNGIQFSEPDVETLLESADLVAIGIREAQREADLLSELEKSRNRQTLAAKSGAAPIRKMDVEHAFRSLFDYASLGDSPLARLKVVRDNLTDRQTTHLDQGKAVNQALREALERMRPEGDLPRPPYPREWFPYLILKFAYLEDVPNREIMSRLYIAEGTFNRTRRNALQAVTRALNELEASNPASEAS